MCSLLHTAHAYVTYVNVHQYCLYSTRQRLKHDKNATRTKSTEKKSVEDTVHTLVPTVVWCCRCTDGKERQRERESVARQLAVKLHPSRRARALDNTSKLLTLRPWEDVCGASAVQTTLTAWKEGLVA